MKTNPMENTYWNHEGAAQKLYDDVNKRIPSSGPCPKSQPKLERLRKAANAYYQLYNNGHCSDFTRIFGVSGRKCFAGDLSAIKASEAKLTYIIKAAYWECYP